MKEAFTQQRFQGSSRILMLRCQEILEEMEAWLPLTLRQLYYQCVSRDIIRNNLKSYKRLGELVNHARLNGLIDWSAIEDRTRTLNGTNHWSNPASVINSAHSGYRIDKWSDQPNHVEVWVEKDALKSVLQRACTKHDVDYFSCRGYGSQSALYQAGKRLGDAQQCGKKPVIIHLGDHDPSGMDMTRDIIARVEMFARCPITVERIALNWDQITQYHPPPNPAKMTDSRYEKYAEEFGEECWELDALHPSIIDELISDAILSYRDDDLYEAREAIETTDRELLEKTSKRWQEVTALLAMEPGTYRFAKPLKRKPKKKKK